MFFVSTSTVTYSQQLPQLMEYGIGLLEDIFIIYLLIFTIYLKYTSIFKICVFNILY